MLEEDLWKKVRKGIGAKWRPQRIEDSNCSDIPDVYFTIPHGSHRTGGWIELKCQEPNRRGGINARHYTQGQRDFAALHQTVFLLLYSGGWFMLFDHAKSDEILRGQTMDWHLQTAIWSSKRPDWAEFTGLLRQRIID